MMKNKLVILSVITIIVMIAATIFSQLRTPELTQDRVPFFPKLSERIESVNRITIIGYTEKINLVRTNNVWGVEEFDHYPALPDRVKSAVLGVADLKINAAKTALPRLYHRLGVEGPEVEDTASLLLVLKDAEENNIAELIVGKPRRSSASQSSPGLYVRKLNDAQSYLVNGILDITAVKTDWIERSLFDIPAEAIQSVRIDHADGDTFTLYKKEKGQEIFELENLPNTKKLASELIINRFGSILQDMHINGASARTKLQLPAEFITAELITFEGMTIKITVFLHNGIPYASFEFRYNEDLLVAGEKKEELKALGEFVDSLNMRTAAWWFEIPEFKFDIIKKRSDVVMRDDGAGVTQEN